jgi:ankyrin repeat protein
MQALSAGKIDVVTALLEQEDSIDLNIANEVGKTALMSLSTRMTANDFDLHKTTTEIVKLLLATGKIDIHATDIDGDIALLGAAAGGHFQVSLILLENGADISVRVSNSARVEVGMSVVAYLLRKEMCVGPASLVQLEFLETILKNHVFAISDQQKKSEVMERADAQGGSLLHYAAASGLPTVVELLLQNGAVVDALQQSKTAVRTGVPDGITPLEAAEEGRSFQERLSGGRVREVSVSFFGLALDVG